VVGGRAAAVAELGEIRQVADQGFCLVFDVYI